MHISKVRNLMKYWQRMLRLQDWDVSISYASFETMQGSLGMNDVDFREKTSKIRLLKCSDRDEERRHVIDLEVTIVHELLHIPFEFFGAKENASRRTEEDQPFSFEMEMFEQAIERMAKSFVKMRNQGRLPYSKHDIFSKSSNKFKNCGCGD